MRDIIIRTASVGQNVECLSNTETFIPTRSKLSASLVAITCINSINKSNVNMEIVNTSSPIGHICSDSKAGGTYCIARWCGNSTKKTPGISLFRIPKDPDRAFLWLTSAERDDLKGLSIEILHTKYLCMEHFNEDMFMNSCKKKLVWNALPTRFPKPGYAYKKECKKDLHRRQQQSDVPGTAKHIVLSKFHQPTRRRPLRPKPLLADPGSVAGLHSQPNTCNAEALKCVGIRVPSADSTQSMKEARSALTEIQTLKMKINDTNAVAKCQIPWQLPVQGSSMLALPYTGVPAAEREEPAGHISTANSIACSNLNEDVGLEEDKTQGVTSTCEYLSVECADSVHHDDDIRDPLCVGENKRNVNDKLINDDSYLNCDVESLCLEHAFRETNERIYPCGYCGEMFLVKSNLVLHQTTYHSDHPVGCELCGKVLYKSRSEFMEHVCERHSESTHS